MHNALVQKAGTHEKLHCCEVKKVQLSSEGDNVKEQGQSGKVLLKSSSSTVKIVQTIASNKAFKTIVFVQTT